MTDDRERQDDEDEIVEIPIEDSIDLHWFRPAETGEVVDAYLEAAAERGLREVRIIHGRGRGVQRSRVQRHLARSPLVERFADAPGERGGWGATLAWLRVEGEPTPDATDAGAEAESGSVEADAPAPERDAKRPSRGEWIAAALIGGGALLLRLLHVAELRANDPFFYRPSVDPVMYHRWAQQIAAGDWLGDEVFGNGPLYPYALALVYAAFGPDLLVARVVQALIGASTCFGVWLLARRLFDPRTALLAMAFAAASTMLIFYDGILVVANLQTALAVWGLLALVRAGESPSAVRFAGAGAIVGLAAIARPNLLLFALLVAAWLLVAARRARPLALRARFAAAFALGVALVVLPVTARNYAVSGDVVLVTWAGGLNLYTGNGPDANGTFTFPERLPRSEIERPRQQLAAYRAYAEEALGRPLRPSEVSSYWVGETVDWVRAHPGATLHVLLRKAGLAINAEEASNLRSVTLVRDLSRVLQLPLPGFGVLWPLAVLGLILSLADWRRLVPLYALLATVFGTMLLFFVLARYRLLAVPVLAIFAARGITGGLDAVRARRVAPLLAALALAGLAAWFAQRPLYFEDRATLYSIQGDRYRVTGQLDRAIVSYQRAVLSEPSRLESYVQLASAYEGLGGHELQTRAVWLEMLRRARRQERPTWVERAERELSALPDPR